MNRQIVLINNSYPYGGESFLMGEITCVPQGVQVNMFPIMPQGKANSEVVNLISNCYLPLNGAKPFFYEYIGAFFTGIYSLLESGEIRALSKKHGAIRNIAKALRFAMLSESRVKAISRHLHNNDGGYIFYSYWMYECAYIGARLKEKYPNSIFITRCHGFDLYEERHPNGYLPFRKYIIESADAIFPISENGKEYLMSHYSEAKPNKVVVSRLGTLKYNATTQKKMDNDEFTIVSCSNLVTVKRIDFLIRALSKCKNKIHWIHIGNGPLMDQLVEMAEHLPNNIDWKFMGAIPNEEILNMYSKENIDLIINVSSSEGIPVSIMEAFSASIPAIATDVGGTSELVKNGENGWLLSSTCSEEELANLIDSIAKMPIETIKKMHNSAYETWFHFYNGEQNYRDFYKKLVLIGDK